MKITIKKNEIVHVLSNLQGLTGKKSALAIISSVLIKTTDNGVKILATDLETGFEGTYPAEIEKHGTIVINSRKFFEIVKDFPSEDIIINEIENHWIKIGNEKVKYNIVGMNPDDFPEAPHITDVNFIQINAKIFKKMLEKMIVISVPTEEKRAHLIGIYFETFTKNDKKIIRMVSTDGNRLSKVDYNYESDLDSPIEKGILLPKKSMQEVVKFLDGEKNIQIDVNNNNFIIKKENETLIVRLLEGEFPKYKEIIKKRDGHILYLNKYLFLMMLKRMSILSSDDYRSVVFNFTRGKLFINTTNPDIGESKEDMDIDFEGESIEVAFNPKFFIDTLNVTDSDNVIVTIVDEEQPCLVEGEGDNTYLSVIMPMRI